MLAYLWEYDCGVSLMQDLGEKENTFSKRDNTDTFCRNATMGMKQRWKTFNRETVGGYRKTVQLYLIQYLL